jgi:DNA-directed RNA polymerase specialized sigma24 family protein
MDTSTGASTPGSDAELLNVIRSGDPGALEVLRARHEAAALTLAAHLTPSPAAAAEIVSAAFAQVLETVTRGGGPSDAFRPYLLAATRRAAAAAGAADDAEDTGSQAAQVPAGARQIPDPGQPLPDQDPAVAASPLVAAFLSLPERWQAVLWHTDIEQAPPAEVAPLLGLAAAEVPELAARARDGLARAERPQATPAQPLYQQAALRSAVPPVFLGAAAAAYLADMAPAAARAGTAAAAGTAGLVSRLQRSAGRHRAALTGSGALRSARRHPGLLAGTATLLAMIAVGASVLSLTPAPVPATAAGTTGADPPVIVPPGGKPPPGHGGRPGDPVACGQHVQVTAASVTASSRNGQCARSGHHAPVTRTTHHRSGPPRRRHPSRRHPGRQHPTPQPSHPQPHTPRPVGPPPPGGHRPRPPHSPWPWPTPHPGWPAPHPGHHHWPGWRWPWPTTHHSPGHHSPGHHSPGHHSPGHHWPGHHWGAHHRRSHQASAQPRWPAWPTEFAESAWLFR